MIEILLEAERHVTMGLLDQAEKLYWQAIEADPQNAIAVVGLARVAVERGDDRTAYAFAVRALELDPENVAAVRLETRLAEVMITRGEAIERPPVALDASRRAEDRARTELGQTARGAPAPKPPVADYPGDRPLGDVASRTAPRSTETEAEDSQDARARWRPGLFRRLTGGR